MEWSDVKQQLFRFETDTVVSAGAGSGKTAALVELYLRLLAGETSLERPLGVDEIVAITFTEKAAAEMKERVRDGIGERAKQGNARVPWEKLLRTLPAAGISTFHAFCSRVLRENPVEAEIDPSFTVADDMVATAELRGAIDEVIEAELAARSPEIRLLLEHFPLAGMGRGKGLRESLAELHRERSTSGKDTGAGLELERYWENEARARFGGNIDCLRSLLCDVERILRGKELAFHQKLRDLPKLYEGTGLALDDDGTPASLRDMQSCIAGNWGKEKPVKERLLECLTTLDLAYQQIRGAPLVRALLHLLGKLEAAYRRRKERMGALDFEDLQSRTRDLLQRDTRLREEYRRKFAVVMVDEFQDTNQLQKELVGLLCGPEQRLFVVGDPKQSIYLFRGADVTVFVRTQKEVEAAGGRNLYFQESFRSREGVIAFVNELFSRVMASGKEEFEVRYGSGDILDPVRKDWDGMPCVEMLTIADGRNAEEKRRLEAVVVARKIRRLVAGESGVLVYDRKVTRKENGEKGITFVSREPRYGDIVLLFRRFSNLKLFERELRRAGIPFYVVKGKGFYRCQEVLDVLNFLTCLEFDDLPALAGVLRSPMCGISDETLYLMGRAEDGLSAWTRHFASPFVLSVPPAWKRIDPGDRDRLENLFRLITRLKPLKDRLTPAELLEEIMMGTDFASILLTTFQGEQKVANLRKLIELSRSFAAGLTGSLRNFINYLIGLAKEEPTEAEAVISVEGGDVVRLMTVHQSKGLEFPIVMIPEIGSGTRPDNSPVKFDNSLGIGLKTRTPGGEGCATLAYEAIGGLRKKKEDAELRRLLYVAVTRARDYLIMSGEGSGPWRTWIDEFSDGPGSSLLRVTEAVDIPPEEAAVPGRNEPKPCDTGILTEALQRSLGYSPPSPSVLVFSPTALEDFAACPRKYYYKEVLGLDEGLFVDLLGLRRNAGRKGTMSALEKGNLAHAMLEALDFAGNETSRRDACRHSARLAGADPDNAEAEEVIENVMSFAVSLSAKEFAGKKLWREYPFVLKVSGAATYYIKGAMDLVAEGDGAVTVYDYKYMKRKEADLEGYRFQVRTYMLALAEGYPGKRIEGKLLFLKGGETESVECDFGSFARTIREIMDAVRGKSREEEFEFREPCDDGRCPFRRNCRPERGNLKKQFCVLSEIS
jgi:ATP-dependent helicase/nuclease subunit A